MSSQLGSVIQHPLGLVQPAKPQEIQDGISSIHSLGGVLSVPKWQGDRVVGDTELYMAAGAATIFIST